MNKKAAKQALVAVLATLIAVTGGCTSTAEEGGDEESSTEQRLKAAEEKLKEIEEEKQRIEENLRKFDELDFDVYTNQKWDRVQESHTEDIVVHWPDGRTTTGIDAHIEDMKSMFVFAPDTHIDKHPIKIASDGWTAVVGISQGTFTRPMPMPDGTSIPPTNRSFKLTMTTVAHWTDEGLMDEEYLFWDNLSLMQQLGLME